MLARPQSTEMVERSECITGVAVDRTLAVEWGPNIRRAVAGTGCSLRCRDMGSRKQLELGEVRAARACRCYRKRPALSDHVHPRPTGTNSEPSDRGSTLCLIRIFLEPDWKLGRDIHISRSVQVDAATDSMAQRCACRIRSTAARPADPLPHGRPDRTSRAAAV